MPEEMGSDSAAAVEEKAKGSGEFESPPPAATPQRTEYDPSARLHELALELVRTQNRRLLVEYLRMRRVAR